MRASLVCLVVGMNITGVVSLSKAAEMALIPVSASGPHTITGNEIVLPSGGQSVVVDLTISGWAPARIVSFQAALDSTGYVSGSAGFLAPISVPCASTADCITNFGRCDFVGSVCTKSSDCEFANFGEVCFSGTTCEPTSNTPGAPLECVPAMITTVRSDYIFSNTSNLPALDVSTPNFRFGGTLLAGAVADPGSPTNGGTLILDVSPDAAGTFVVNLISNGSLLLDDTSSNVTPLLLTPLRITIGCTSSADCDDGNPCTNDVCNLTQNCTHSPNFDQKISCCNPSDGSLCAFPAGLPGDTDGDFDVDLLDAALFQTCFGSASIPIACGGTDLDCNCGSGASDHALLVPAITGPSGP